MRLESGILALNKAGISYNEAGKESRNELSEFGKQQTELRLPNGNQQVCLD